MLSRGHKPAPGMQHTSRPQMQLRACSAMPSQRRTPCQHPSHNQHSCSAAQCRKTAAQHMQGSMCSRHHSSRSVASSRVGTMEHGAAHVHISRIGTNGSWPPVQLGTAGGRRRSQRRSHCTVAKAKPPRMRGQACDLRERPCSTALPAVDWRRYHLNVLFVDRSDTVRARVAAGLFERVSEWNGWGRILLTATAGVDAQPDSPPDMSTNMALFSQAGLLGIRPKLFAAAPERFEADDFYRYDAIVALDEGVRRRIVDMGFEENPAESHWYTKRVCSLGAFSYYCGDELLAHGGSALLEKELVRILLPVLPAARQQSEIPRPDLARGPEEWNPMVAAVLVAVAGLFKYLADEYPPDLPEYDPV